MKIEESKDPSGKRKFFVHDNWGRTHGPFTELTYQGDRPAHGRTNQVVQMFQVVFCGSPQELHVYEDAVLPLFPHP